MKTLQDLKTVEVIRKCGVPGKIVLHKSQRLRLKALVPHIEDPTKDSVVVEGSTGESFKIRAKFICVPDDPMHTPLNEHPLWEEMVCAISPIRAAAIKRNAEAMPELNSLRDLKRVEVVRKCGVAGKMNFVLRPGQLLNLKKINFSTGNRQKDTVTVELDGGKRIRIRAEYVCVPGDKSKTALNNHPLWHEMAAEEGIEKNAETSDSVGASAIDTYRGKVDPSSPEPIKFAPPVDLYLWYSNVTNRQVDSVLNLFTLRELAELRGLSAAWHQVNGPQTPLDAKSITYRELEAALIESGETEIFEDTVQAIFEVVGGQGCEAVNCSSFDLALAFLCSSNHHQRFQTVMSLVIGDGQYMDQEQFGLFMRMMLVDGPYTLSSVALALSDATSPVFGELEKIVTTFETNIELLDEFSRDAADELFEEIDMSGEGIVSVEDFWMVFRITDGSFTDILQKHDLVPPIISSVYDSARLEKLLQFPLKDPVPSGTPEEVDQKTIDMNNRKESEARMAGDRLQELRGRMEQLVKEFHFGAPTDLTDILFDIEELLEAPRSDFEFEWLPSSRRAYIECVIELILGAVEPKTAKVQLESNPDADIRELFVETSLANWPMMLSRLAVDQRLSRRDRPVFLWAQRLMAQLLMTVRNTCSPQVLTRLQTALADGGAIHTLARALHLGPTSQLCLKLLLTNHLANQVLWASCNGPTEVMHRLDNCPRESDEATSLLQLLSSCMNGPTSAPVLAALAQNGFLGYLAHDLVHWSSWRQQRALALVLQWVHSGGRAASQDVAQCGFILPPLLELLRLPEPEVIEPLKLRPVNEETLVKAKNNKKNTPLTDPYIDDRVHVAKSMHKLFRRMSTLHSFADQPLLLRILSIALRNGKETAQDILCKLGMSKLLVHLFSIPLDQRTSRLTAELYEVLVAYLDGNSATQQDALNCGIWKAVCDSLRALNQEEGGVVSERVAVSTCNACRAFEPLLESDDPAVSSQSRKDAVANHFGSHLQVVMHAPIFGEIPESMQSAATICSMVVGHHRT